MMDRVLLWQVSQMRRRDLLETAGVVGRREGLRSWSGTGALRSLSIRGMKALVDRLVHHAEVIVMRGESYRLKGKQRELLEGEGKN
ncbi:MAG: ATP-binding protein [Actinomycetia bacterium]|nr:ATP-binding protein [Actinomycetes bacterium]